MKEKLRQFMYGRYGSDNLSRFILVLALIAIILFYIFKILILYYVGLVLLVLNILRTMSRNHSARYRENEAYLRIRNGFTGFWKNLFSGKSSSGAADKTHRIYKCPSCGQKVRVPRGKGRIAITCPKCRTSFVKRT